jgi:hypothetical protein
MYYPDSSEHSRPAFVFKARKDRDASAASFRFMLLFGGKVPIRVLRLNLRPHDDLAPRQYIRTARWRVATTISASVSVPLNGHIPATTSGHVGRTR